MSFSVSKTIPRPAKALHTPLSAEDNSSRALALSSLGCSVQYSGKPSKAEGSCLAQHTLKNFPFQLLYEFWKRERRILPAIPEKLTQKLFPCFFTSKKCRKTSTEGRTPRYPQRI